MAKISNRGEEIGALHFAVGAKLDDFKQGMDEVRHEAADTSKDVKRDVDSVEESFDKAGKRASALGDTIRDIAGPAALVALVADLASRFQDALVAAEALEEQIKATLEAEDATIRSQLIALRASGDTERAQLELLEEFQTKRKETITSLEQDLKRLDSVTNQVVSSFAALFTDKPTTRSEVVEARRKQLEELDKDFEQRQRILAEFEKKNNNEVFEALSKQNDDLELQRLTGIERIAEEERRSNSEIADLSDKAQTEAQRREIQRRREINAADFEDRRRKLQALERIQREANERLAQQQEQALQAIQDRTVASFERAIGSVQGQLSEIISSLRELGDRR